MSAPPGDVGVELLLGRRVLDVGAGQGDYLRGRTGLLTGAGGSVGSALAERLAGLGVRRLVLVDQAEAPLVGLARMLQHEHGFSGATPVLADIAGRKRMRELFLRHRPDVVFHAAAYKHVPLLEDSPVEGAATNVLGTASVVDAALHAGVGRFVLFSTDKAVQPRSVLGRTKAVSEWVVAAAGRAGGGRYSSVRLANVLDSAGSIVPMFRCQLAAGGPITVTHPEATRFLMTVGEAAGLAVVAGGLGEPGSAYWLDVGGAVPVVELARRLAAGETPIEYVGLRPGENLHERLYDEADEIAPTACDRVWRSTLERVDARWLDSCLAALGAHVRDASADGVRALLAEMVETPAAGELRPAVAL